MPNLPQKPVIWCISLLMLCPLCVFAINEGKIKSSDFFSRTGKSPSLARDWNEVKLTCNNMQYSQMLGIET